MNIKIISKDENLILIDKEEYYLKNSSVSIDKDKSFFIYVYPLSFSSTKIYLPRVVAIDIKKNKLSSSDRFIRLVNYKNRSEITIQQYMIQKPNNSSVLNEYEFVFSEKKYIAQVYKGCANNLVIRSNIIHLETTIADVEACTFFKVNNYIILNYTNNQDNLLIYGLLENKILFNEPIFQFEIDEINGKITVLRKLNDALNHGNVIVFDIKRQFKELDNYATYLTEPQSLDKRLLEFLFFDCVKAKNFKKARTFLTDDLSQITTDTSLIKYFENYQEIQCGEQENEFYLLPYGNIIDAHIIKFEKLDNLINNIKTLYKPE